MLVAPMEVACHAARDAQCRGGQRLGRISPAPSFLERMRGGGIPVPDPDGLPVEALHPAPGLTPRRRRARTPVAHSASLPGHPAAVVPRFEVLVLSVRGVLSDRYIELAECGLFFSAARPR